MEKSRIAEFDLDTEQTEEERVTHELILDQPVYIGTDVSLHLFEIREEAIRIGVDAPRTTRVKRQEKKRKKSRENRSKSGYLGRGVVQRKSCYARMLRLQALIDIPEYGIIEGAQLLFFYRRHYYWISDSNGKVVEWPYWSEDDLKAEIEGGLWAVVS